MKEMAAYIFRAEISTFHILIVLETLEHDAIHKVFSKFLDIKEILICARVGRAYQFYCSLLYQGKNRDTDMYKV